MKAWLRPAALFAIGTLASVALANGAMGLGLEQWSLSYWFVYVLVTVVFEAFYIGRRIELTPGKSIGASVVGNLLTGVVCAGGGLCAPALHMAFIGSSINPNPLLNALFLLSAFALPSAVVEALVWRLFSRGTFVALHKGKIVWSSILAHLIGIPLAAVILLIPERPYQGLEAMTSYYREHALIRGLRNIFGQKERWPRIDTGSLEQLFRKTLPAEDLWATLYDPEFHRFDTEESRRRPLVFNEALSNLPLFASGDDWRWLVRAPSEKATRELCVNLANGDVQFRAVTTLTSK